MHEDSFTMRDEFARAAMQSLLIIHPTVNIEEYDKKLLQLCEKSYIVANMMITARNR